MKSSTIKRSLNMYAHILFEKGYLDKQVGISKKAFRGSMKKTIRTKLAIAKMADAPELAFRFVAFVPLNIGKDTATYLVKFRLMQETDRLKLVAMGIKVNGSPATVFPIRSLKELPVALKLFEQVAGVKYKHSKKDLCVVSQETGNRLKK